MFKKGDFIRCINKEGNPTSILVVGRIYEVSDIGEFQSGWISLKNETGVWSDYQFEMAERPKTEIKVYGIVKFLEGIKR